MKMIFKFGETMRVVEEVGYGIVEMQRYGSEMKISTRKKEMKEK